MTYILISVFIGTAFAGEGTGHSHGPSSNELIIGVIVLAALAGIGAWIHFFGKKR